MIKPAGSRQTYWCISPTWHCAPAIELGHMLPQSCSWTMDWGVGAPTSNPNGDAKLAAYAEVSLNHVHE
jgi:hypothetical protein